jgi:hypothetical protein
MSSFGLSFPTIVLYFSDHPAANLDIKHDPKGQQKEGGHHVGI